MIDQRFDLGRHRAVLTRQRADPPSLRPDAGLGGVLHQHRVTGFAAKSHGHQAQTGLDHIIGDGGVKIVYQDRGTVISGVEGIDADAAVVQGVLLDEAFVVGDHG